MQHKTDYFKLFLTPLTFWWNDLNTFKFFAAYLISYFIYFLIYFVVILLIYGSLKNFMLAPKDFTQLILKLIELVLGLILSLVLTFLAVNVAFNAFKFLGLKHAKFDLMKFIKLVILFIAYVVFSFFSILNLKLLIPLIVLIVLTLLSLLLVLVNPILVVVPLIVGLITVIYFFAMYTYNLIRMVFAWIIFVQKDISILVALKEGFELTHHRFWKLLAFLLVYELPILIITATFWFAGLVLGAIFLILLNSYELFFLFAIPSLVLPSVFFTVIQIYYHIVLYNEFVKTKAL